MLASIFIYTVLLWLSCLFTFTCSLKLNQVGKLKLSEIGVGTWAWGNRLLWNYDKFQDDQIYETYKYSVSKGVNWFDTADSYGTGDLDGRSEQLLGLFNSKLNTPTSRKSNNNSPYICTKLAPYPWRIGSNAMKVAANQSIQRLNKPIDILQLHWPPSLQWQERTYIQSFSDLINDGKATQIGVSNYGPKGLKRVTKIANDYGQQIYSNQVQFSLLSRYPLMNGLVEDCQEKGIQLIGYSPLALGLLTDKYSIEKNNLPTGLRGFLFREYLPVIQPLLSELRELAAYKKKTVSQIVLNWNLQKGVLVLVGARTVSQIQENLGSTGWSLSKNEVECIDIATKKIKKQLVQNSFQSD